jgi:hypothetical protein
MDIIKAKVFLSLLKRIIYKQKDSMPPYDYTDCIYIINKLKEYINVQNTK